MHKELYPHYNIMDFLQHKQVCIIMLAYMRMPMWSIVHTDYSALSSRMYQNAGCTLLFFPSSTVLEVVYFWCEITFHSWLCKSCWPVNNFSEWNVSGCKVCKFWKIVSDLFQLYLTFCQQDFRQEDSPDLAMQKAQHSRMVQQEMEEILELLLYPR